MKIAFLISAGRFPSEILQELRAQLPQDQLIHWTRGESSPATDIEVLLVLGEVTAAQMARQTKLALIQTVRRRKETKLSVSKWPLMRTDDIVPFTVEPLWM